MRLITQAEVFSLIQELNEFVDKAEKLINHTRLTYESNKQSMIRKYNSSVTHLESSYKSNCNAISTKSNQAINEAHQMLEDVEKMDANLTKKDRYYKKTKEKKEEELQNVISGNFNDTGDYFLILEEIRANYISISRKYSEDMLPGLINGLNYLFSSKRKKDYEELIVLLNTIRSFVSEIKNELPSITNESLTYQENLYSSKSKELQSKYERDLSILEDKYYNTMDSVADKICTKLDNIFPDELVVYLSSLYSKYQNNFMKLNSTRIIKDNMFHMFFVDYPVDYFVQSKVVSSLIKEKCSRMLIDQAIRFPILTSTQDAPVWQISSTGKDNDYARIISHSLIYSFLSSCPVSQLTVSVIDPENRGTSVAPYYDAKKKLQELFDNSFIVSRDEITQKINYLTQYVESVLQEKLGTEFNTIYDYAEAYDDYNLEPKLLVIYDYPKGFDDHTVSSLRNIIKNGSQCGVYTIIVPTGQQENDSRYQNDYSKGINALEGLTSKIMCSNGSYSLRGMPLFFNSMPNKTEFNQFFSKYMLLYEGIKNKGIAFSPQIKALIDSKDEREFDNHIVHFKKLLSDYADRYFNVPDIDALYPDTITSGSILYPADVFSESIGFDKIKKVFCEDEQVPSNKIKLPLDLDLTNNFNILLYSNEQTAENIREFTHHIMWNLLSYIPITKVNFNIIDVESRNSTKPFADFRKALPELFSINTDRNQINDVLQQLNNIIDDFTQNKLGSRYDNILEYNKSTTKRAEAINLLVIYDFPKGFDSRATDTLLSIMKNGNKCGIYTVICYDPEIKLSRYESIDDNLEQIQKYSISVEYKDNMYQLMPFGLPILIPEKKDANQVSLFVKKYSEKAEIIKRRGISFSDILPEIFFESQSSSNLRIPIGIGDEDAIVNIVFGEGTSHHCLIGGGTGGGKSTLLHTIIMSGMMNYSPDQLHLYLMDFKGGTEFKIYESQRLPHINLLALDAMQEFGESILINIVEEMENRSKTFKDSGGYTKIQDYVSGTGNPMPRILIIMDEFQILFNDSTNRKVAMNCANLAKRIVTEGRAFGIHLMMATQSTNIISTLTLDRGTIEQMRVRVGLKCGDGDTRYLFSDLYCDDAKRKMMGPKGTAVLNEDYTETPENNDTSLILGNQGLRVAYCNDSIKETYLKQISKTFEGIECTTQIFEGGRTVNLLSYLNDIQAHITTQQPVYIHMGEKIKVAPPFGISLDRKKKHNMLICGTNVSMTENILNNYLISALLNESSTIYCIDGDVLVGEGASEKMYRVLSDNTGRFHVANSRADIVMFIHDIYEEYQRRKKSSIKDTICVVIKNLQYTDIIKSMFKGDRVDESEYLDDENVEEVMSTENQLQTESNEPDPMDFFAAFNSVVAARNARKEVSTKKTSRQSSGYSNDKVAKLIEDGSGFGIHFVVTSSDFQTVKETMRFGENLLSKFPERFVFSLSNNDAENLIDGVSVAGLNNNIVYYTDGIRDTFQLKPYISPTPEDVDIFFKSLKDNDSILLENTD